MPNRKALGDWGEEQAARYLMLRGYRILERNYHSRYGEIDIIAARGGFVVFVEVKLRKSDRYGAAAEAVTAAKQEKVRTTAILWLQARECRQQPRFDVMEIYAPEGEQTRRPVINHIENAF